MLVISHVCTFCYFRLFVCRGESEFAWGPGEVCLGQGTGRLTDAAIVPDTESFTSSLMLGKKSIIKYFIMLKEKLILYVMQ